MTSEFYTYAYLREDRTPYYIGKGCRDRAYYKRKRIKPPKDKSRILVLKRNLTEEEAFRHEVYMIAVFGRKDLGTGILRNLTNGGEGSSGWVASGETRKKMSEAKRGKPKSEKAKRKMSEARRGKNHPQYDKRWWNDGRGTVALSAECPGEGWILGRKLKVKEFLP